MIEMKFNRLVQGTERGLQYAAAVALCVPIGTLQWFDFADSYERRIGINEMLLRETNDPIERKERVARLGYLYTTQPTLLDCISGMYQFFNPYPRV